MNRSWLIILLAAAMAFAGLVVAAGTPADTEITNQASATFNDSAGQARTTTSNQVVTVVQQVDGVSLAPLAATETALGQTKRGLPGASVYFTYTLENTGNGTDSYSFVAANGTGDTGGKDFTGTSVFDDANCNGVVDSGETNVTSGAVELAADDSSCLIAQATIDGTAANGNTLNLNLTANSAFGSATANSWAQAIAETRGTIDITVARDPSGTVTTGTQMSYVFSGSNTGGAEAYGVDVTSVLDSNVTGYGIIVTSPVPAGTDFVSVAGFAGAGAGTSFAFHDSQAGEWTTTQPATLADIDEVAMIIAAPNPGTNSFFSQGATYQMTLTVGVDGTLDVSSDISNSGSVHYSANGTTAIEASSNTVSNDQAQSYAVTVAPAGTGYGSWARSVSGDTQTLSGPVYSGDTVLFKNTLTNGGTTDDSFTLSFSGAATGWTCGFRQVDGVTPLSGAVGPLPEAGTFDLAFACTISATATTSAATNMVITATSVASTGQTDTTTNTVPAVTSGYGVSLGSNGAAIDLVTAAGADYSSAIEPGTNFYVPLTVENLGNNSDLFNLAVGNLPSGWTMAIHEDATCDKVADATAPVSKTDLLESTDGSAGTGPDTACFVAVGSVPANQAPGLLSAALTFTATSTNDAAKTDSVTDTDDLININTVNSLTIDPDRSGTVTAPGTVTYSVNVQNNGNDAQTVTVTPGTSPNGWTYQVLEFDGSTWVVDSDSSVSVAAGATAEVRVRVIVPAGEPTGRVESVAVTASDGTASDSVTLGTTVVGGDLTLENSAETCSDAACTASVDGDGDTAEPGQYLQYTLVASNIGTANISEVILMIPLPNFTDFVSVSATSTTGDGTDEIIYSTDGASWSSTAPTSISAAGYAVYVGVNSDGDTTPTISSGDVVEPAATITVTLTVQVE
jgi:uncharacterized repeat protein (TIGR01451 family)